MKQTVRKTLIQITKAGDKCKHILYYVCGSSCRHFFSEYRVCRTCRENFRKKSNGMCLPDGHLVVLPLRAVNRRKSPRRRTPLILIAWDQWFQAVQRFMHWSKLILCKIWHFRRKVAYILWNIIRDHLLTKYLFSRIYLYMYIKVFAHRRKASFSIK